jgi:hypothetical protein
MAGSFRQLHKSLVPRWLSEGEGELVGYALDLILDAFVERMRLGHLVCFPQQDANGTPGPADAAIALGRDRRVVRGINESASSYAVRLKSWLVDRRTAGNPYTLMRQLAAYVGPSEGASFRTVDVRGNWYSRSASGVETASLGTLNWNWDGNLSQWSRFWVIIYPGTQWTTEGAWGTGTWGDTSGTIGTTITPEQATTLRAIVADWKPAGTSQNIVIATNAASFSPASPEPNGTWGKWYRYSGGTAIASRLSTARYFGA